MTNIATITGLLLQRDLRGLIRQIEAFPDDASVWAQPPGIANSAGNLALHIAGNVQHFIGARLGDTGFVRDRDREFSSRMIPRTDLVAGLERAIDAVRVALIERGDKPLPEVFPDVVAGNRISTEIMLTHLAVHLGYHLGQVDYHRRLTTGNPGTVDAVAVKELPIAR